MAATKVLGIRLDEEQWRLLDAAAEMCGQTPSEYARQVIRVALAGTLDIRQPARGGTLTESIPAALLDQETAEAQTLHDRGIRSEEDVRLDAYAQWKKEGR